MEVMLHVLHVNNNLNTGGAETYLVRLCNTQVERGLRVSVVAGQPWTLRKYLHPKVEVYDVALSQPDVRIRFPSTYLSNLIKGIPRLRKIVVNNGVSLIHTHLAQSAVAGWWVGRLHRVPTLHSIMHLESAAGPWHRLIFRLGLPQRIASGFMTFSEYATRELKTIHGITESKIHLARMGINTKEFTPRPWAAQAIRQRYRIPPDSLLLGLTARLELVKDVALAIHTMASLKQMGVDNVFLLVAGDGSQREELRRLASGLGVENLVLFLGRLDDTRELVCGLDVYFQTTKGPNLGIAALEALACGVPLLIAARGEDERLMAEDTLQDTSAGWVVEAKSELLARQVLSLWHDSVTISKAKEAARQVAEKYYDWDTHVGLVSEIYQKLALQRI